MNRTATLQALTLVAAVAAIITVPVATPAQAQTTEQLARLDSIASAPVDEGKVAGIAVALVRGGDTLLMRAYGEADLAWDVPLTTDAVFEIGSVTKQFTAAAILKLRDEGKLDLDDDISEYLPDFSTQGHRIPLRRLLDHTSGMKGATEMASFRSLSAQSLPRDSLLTLIAAEPYDFPPGEALIYNNSGYILLGHIIEKATGRTYEDYIEEEFFADLGMERSSYCSNTEIVERKAYGYQPGPDGLARSAQAIHIWPYSAGSLCSTVGDLVRWLDALHGGEVLSAASYHDLITPFPLNDGTAVRYAMGLSVAPDPSGRDVLGHGGGIQGFVSDTRYYPDSDLSVAVLINTVGGASPAAVANDLVDVLIPPVPVPDRKFEGDASPLEGTYEGPARGRKLTVTVAVTDEGVTLDNGRGEPTLLNWDHSWTFRAGQVQIITFESTSETGPADVLRVDGGGSHYVLKRIPE